MEFPEAIHRLLVLARGAEGLGFHLGPRPTPTARAPRSWAGPTAPRRRGRVVGSQLAPLLGVQGAFHQGSEDGRFHVAPIVPGGLGKNVDLIFVQGEGAGVLEQSAIETQELLFQDSEKNRLGSWWSKAIPAFLEDLRIAFHFRQQVFEGPFGKELHVFGEHGENRAHEEGEDVLGRESRTFQRAGQFGQGVRDFARHAGGSAALSNSFFI